MNFRTKPNIDFAYPGLLMAAFIYNANVAAWGSVFNAWRVK
jgi:hypothetical protein